MRSHAFLLGSMAVLGVLSGCRQGPLSGRSDDSRHVQILTAGVKDYPSALHGGVLMRAGQDSVELVVAPDGRVRVYARDPGGQESGTRGADGTITVRPAGGASTTVALQPDPANNTLTAQLPPPAAPYSDYDLNLSFRGRRLTTGAQVLPGGTETTREVARAAGDEPVIPTQAVGGGPRDPAASTAPAPTASPGPGARP